VLRLSKFVRFCFGLQVICLVGDLAALLIPLVFLSRGATWNPELLQSMLLAALGALVLDLAPAIAWWTLKKGKASGRAWALAASFINLIPTPTPAIGHPRSLWIFSRMLHLPLWGVGALVGAAGLVAFSRRQGADEVADARQPKPSRVSGDGTSGHKDRIASAVAFAVLVLSYYWWAHWGAAQHLPLHGLLMGFVELQIAILVSTFGHELGHLVAGWLSDMRLRSFQVGPLLWAIRNGRWKFDFRLNRLSGGAVGMVPMHLKNIRGRQAFMILGGPIASLLVGTISGVAALSAKGHAWEPLWVVLSMTAVVSSVGFMVNLIPQKPDAHYSDGAQIYQVVTNGAWAQVHLAFAMVASSLVTSLRPRDFDIALIHRAGGFIAQNERGMLLRVFACMHHIDAGQIPEAIVSLEKAEALWDQAAVKRPAGICSEFVFFCAVYKRDAAAAELWWQRLETQSKIDFDADYWKARASIMWLRNQPAEAFHAWERGNALAAKLPASGAYEFTRSCFERLRSVLDAPAPRKLAPSVVEPEPVHS
jgi:hypothetical protein